MPKRLDKREWQHTQDYWREKDEFPQIDLDDTVFHYERRRDPALSKEAASTASSEEPKPVFVSSSPI
jgi:hypothetical protein